MHTKSPLEMDADYRRSDPFGHLSRSRRLRLHLANAFGKVRFVPSFLHQLSTWGRGTIRLPRGMKRKMLFTSTAQRSQTMSSQGITYSFPNLSFPQLLWVIRYFHSQRLEIGRLPLDVNSVPRSRNPFFCTIP